LSGAKNLKLGGLSTRSIFILANMEHNLIKKNNFLSAKDL